MTRRCVIAVRVSEDDKDQDPQNQLLPLRAAVARQGWQVADVVEIVGLSAWNARTAAEIKRRFLAPIVAGRADTLCVWALDRVTRGGIEPTLAFIRELETHLGASLFSLQEPWASSATQDPSTRQLIASLMAWVAERESARKSERVRAKVHAKRNRAGVLGQSARWGRGVLASAEQVDQVLELRRADPGATGYAIAAKVGLSKSQVYRILAAPPVPREPLGRRASETVDDAPSDAGGLGQPDSTPHGSAKQ
jgi:DNA invertase Pin-like site-specific DNA recombinase